MDVWAIAIGAAIYLAALLALIIPQVRRLEARREEVGDRELPVRWFLTGIAIVGVAAAAGLALIARGSAAGWAVAAVGIPAGLQVILSAARRAQRT
jgi:hypothetical protein